MGFDWCDKKEIVLWLKLRPKIPRWLRLYSVRGIEMTNKMMIVVLVISAAVFSSWPVQAADEPNDRVCKEEGRVLTERG